MNQMCKVCGEPAAGFHFGAFTCEGCKSFFGRTYNNISAISGCKNNGDCIINKKNRTACKACRLRKCLLVGMSKSGSRYGRRSNWFKIHCLLQEQQSQHQQQQQHNSTNNNNNNSTKHDNKSLSPQQHITSTNLEQFSLTHQHLLAKQTYQDKTNPSIKSVALQNSNLLINSFLPAHQMLNGSNKKNNNNNYNNNNNTNHNNNSTIKYPLSKSEPVNRSRSPSDSGASSADPDENYSNSNKDLQIMHSNNSAGGDVGSGSAGSSDRDVCAIRNSSRNGGQQEEDVGCGSIEIEDGIIHDEDINDAENYSNNCINNKTNNPLLNSFSMNPLVRSSSEPLKHFPLFTKGYNNLTNSNTFIGNVLNPFTNFFAPIDCANNTNLKSICSNDGQDEPIDLSIKNSNYKTSISSSSSSSPTSSLQPPAILRTLDIGNKPTPLDLTLVRSQPTSG